MCAIICADRYPSPEQLFRKLATSLEYFGHGGETAEAPREWSAACNEWK
jgi:hypothetical protein